MRLRQSMKQRAEALNCSLVSVVTLPLQNLKPDAEFILNTIPAMVLKQVPSDSVAIELASKAGMAGENIISARGLPGKMRPEESGKLIAETFMRLSENPGGDL